MEKIRLDKFISSQLGVSRSEAKMFIRKGLVSVNGSDCKSSDLQIEPQCDTVFCFGKSVSYNKHLYIMMNKPDGVVSASKSENDTTVIDILPENLRRKGLFPAGRLDKDTTGFMLITDDGEFAHSILSPRRHVPKTYELTARRLVTDEEFIRFSEGVELGDIVLKPAKLEYIGFDSELDGCPRYSITIVEGRYHQIKRMFAKTDNKVLKLRRISIGSLALDESLLPGQCREMTDEELGRIKAELQ